MTRSKVLAVDDNEANLAVLEELLVPEFEVRCADQGEWALQLAEEWPPDVVLLDVKMPGIDGFETCRRLRKVPGASQARIIMVSAKDGVADRLTGYDAGADDYVTKPFEEREVLAKVRASSRIRVSHDIQALVAQVEATRDLAGEALANLARSRDTETGEHLFRIRGIAQLVAQEMKARGYYRDEITDEFLAALYRASPLHDVGKVAIPDAILRKPGKLTPSERKVMEQHTILGANIIEHSIVSSGHGDFLKMAAVVARSHHEWFDGSGYPDGLAGTAIPLPARIVAIADVYDALRSKRVYKESNSAEDSVVLIMHESQKHFDPLVVAAFLECLESCEAIICQSSEDSHHENLHPQELGLDPPSAPQESAAT